MDKILKIFTYVDGVNDTPFPNADAQIEILSFNYDAKRMGGAPTISATVLYDNCLDKLWTGKEYVWYNGERYKLKQTPSSSKSNTDARYKHELEFVAMRVVLDYVYFFDAIGDTDKPVTNNTKVVFSGDIHEFVRRLNASLQYTGLQIVKNGEYVSGYRVVVVKGITSETKFLEFTDQPISSVLQEIYKQYEIPYYFVGNEIHIGYMSNAITTPFKYGVNDALLSISKNNANYKIVNRCTGVGSSDNLPYYYPNEHPLGVVNSFYNGATNSALTVVDKEKFAEKVKLGTVLTYELREETEIIADDYIYYVETARKFEETDGYDMLCDAINDGKTPATNTTQSLYRVDRRLSICAPLFFAKDSFLYYKETEDWSAEDKQYAYYKYINPITTPLIFTNGGAYATLFTKIDRKKYSGKKISVEVVIEKTEGEFSREAGQVYLVQSFSDGKAYLSSGDKGEVLVDEMLDDYLIIQYSGYTPETALVYYNLKLTLGTPFVSYNWYNEKGAIIDLADYGLAYSGEISIGDKITFESEEGSIIPFQNALMPSIYRESGGTEAFYNAKNDTYVSPETGTFYDFNNEYSDANRREHKETFDYIKPSIENVLNSANKPINMFLEFAYDELDSDEVDEDGNYVHPYFFGKLRKFDGESGFNLFDHANEQGEMTISMTSGNCGACNFVIGVHEETKKNIVQIYEEDVYNEDGTEKLQAKGDLVRDEFGNVVRTGNAQDAQNDTINNEVWIALRKDTNTFFDIMPNAFFKYKPKSCTKTDGVYADDGDTFVITNITFPTQYIIAAEKRLEEEIIKYMKLNNDEKFTFSIKFSRIYLAENPDIFSEINENARLSVIYDGVEKEFYISSYQYKVIANEALPEITVELADTLSTNENAIQRALGEIEHNIMSSVGSIDFYKQGLQYFIRKDVEDYARGLLHLQKGVTFGVDDIAKIDENGNASLVSSIIEQFISTPLFIDGFAGQGFKLWLDESGNTNLTVDNLTARNTFRVFELLITKLRAVNGGLFVSAANGTIQSVSESEDNLYYELLLEQTHGFKAGDYIRSQTMSGTVISSYWVEVVEAEGRRLKLLKSEFNGSIPYEGQDVVLCGSRDTARQNAIHISASDDGQPRIDVLNGIAPTVVDGVKTISLDGCLRTRLGNLDGIYDAYFGDNQPQGDGLYSDNAYLKGEFILANRGKSVDTLFAIQEGKLQSSIAQTQLEAINGKTLLYNASFTKGLDGWETSNKFAIYKNNTALLFNNSSLLQKSVSISNTPIFDDVYCLKLNKGWVKQRNWRFVDKPAFTEPNEGDSNNYPFNVSLNIKALSVGWLCLGLNDANKYKADDEADSQLCAILITEPLDDASIQFRTGDVVNVSNIYDLYCYEADGETKHVFNNGDIVFLDLVNTAWSLDAETWLKIDLTDKGVYDGAEDTDLNIAYDIVLLEKLTAASEYEKFAKTGRWNGDGDFFMYYTGEANIYGLQLFTDTIEVTHRTLFEQTDRLLSLTAAIYDKDQEKLQESGLVIMPESAGLFTKDENGNVATIGTYEGGVVKLSGSEIRLEGDVSVNGKVRIDEETGTLYAEDGVFSGKITSEEGYIGGFTIRAEDLFTELNDQENEDYYKTMLLSKEVIHFHNHEYVPEQEYNGVIVEQEVVKNIHVRLGAKTLPSTIGFETAPLKIDIDDNHKANVNIGAYIDVVNASANDNVVMTGNHAVYIPNGDICGFRLRTRRIDADTTLSVMDSIILVTSACSIILPENAEDGQIYIFKRMGGQLTYIILPQGDDKIWGYTSVAESIEVTSSVSIILHYDKINKYWCGGFLSHFT